MLNTIVVGVDARSGGDDALALARRLSQLDDAAVVVTSATVTASGRGLRTSENAERDAEHALNRARAHLGAEANVEVRPSEGPTVAAALERLTAETGADLVVVGASHRAPAGQVLGGSILSELLHAGIPVAVAPQGFATRAPRDWRQVAVAVDDSEASDAAVAFAATLTRVTGEPLRRVDLVAVDPRPVLETFPDGEPVPEAASKRMELDQLVARAAARLPDGVEVGETRAFGPPGEALEDITRDRDVLVCGAHGRGTLGRLLFGSVSETVASHPGCPVVIVPAAAERAAS